MTCHELHSYFEGQQVSAMPLDSREIAAHASTCESCSRFLEERTELAASLRLLRESAPDVSASVDAVVFAGYRRFCAGKSTSVSSVPAPARTRFVLGFAWAAAILVAVFVARFELRLLFPTEDAATVQPHTAPAIAHKSTSPAKTPIPSEAKHSLPSSSLAMKRKRGAVTSTRQVAVTDKSATSAMPAAEASAGSLPVGFRSLMYCDALSCSGPMEIIRVQLPPLAAGFGPASTQTNDVIYADVLVGPDGIARGIRVLP